MLVYLKLFHVGSRTIMSGIHHIHKNNMSSILPPVSQTAHSCQPPVCISHESLKYIPTLRKHGVPDNWGFIIVLRNPISRFLSVFYTWNFNHTGRSNYEGLPHYFHAPFIKNRSWFGWDLPSIERGIMKTPNLLDFGNYKLYEQLFGNEVEAKKLFQKFQVVGITENMPNIIRKICSYLEFTQSMTDCIALFASEHVHSEYPHIHDHSSHFIKFLEEIFSVEFKIYNEAVSLS